jgi:transposase
MRRRQPIGSGRVQSTLGRAAASTVEALMYSLRERGTAALKEAATLRRLADLDDQQIVDVGERLQQLPLHTPWTADEIELLMIAREGLRRD